MLQKLAYPPNISEYAEVIFTKFGLGKHAMAHFGFLRELFSFFIYSWENPDMTRLHRLMNFDDMYIIYSCSITRS